MLVTYERYVSLTGDDCTGEYQVTARIERATAALEGRLNGRLLESMERTEVLRVGTDARVYPHAWPVTALPADAAYQIDPLSNATIRWVWPDDITFNWPAGNSYIGWCEPFWATVTYTGGYTDETLPPELAEAIAGLAASYATAGTPALAGATSVRLGDAAVTYGGTGGLAGLDARVPGISDTILRYGYRRWST